MYKIGIYQYILGPQMGIWAPNWDRQVPGTGKAPDLMAFAESQTGHSGIHYNSRSVCTGVCAAGIIDDVYGADFVDGSTDGNVQDQNGHGTFVAGVVGAVGNNGLGVTGVNQVQPPKTMMQLVPQICRIHIQPWRSYAKLLCFSPPM